MEDQGSRNLAGLSSVDETWVTDRLIGPILASTIAPVLDCRAQIKEIRWKVRRGVSSMRNLWNCLSDPALHLLGIAVLLIYLTLGGGGQGNRPRAESHLVACSLCHVHHYSDSACNLTINPKLAHVRH